MEKGGRDKFFLRNEASEHCAIAKKGGSEKREGFQRGFLEDRSKGPPKLKGCSAHRSGGKSFPQLRKNKKTVPSGKQRALFFCTGGKSGHPQKNTSQHNGRHGYALSKKERSTTKEPP